MSLRAYQYTTEAPHNEWATPQDLFDKLNAEFGFSLDACANASNAKCEAFYTVEQDGLSQPWTGVVWCNPPYTGRVVDKWVLKAYEASKQGATVVMLIPSRTGAWYFQDYCLKHGEVRFVRAKLRFGGAKDVAPFYSAVVVFRPNTQS